MLPATSPARTAKEQQDRRTQLAARPGSCRAGLRDEPDHPGLRSPCGAALQARGPGTEEDNSPRPRPLPRSHLALPQGARGATVQGAPGFHGSAHWTAAPREPFAIGTLRSLGRELGGIASLCDEVSCSGRPTFHPPQHEERRISALAPSARGAVQYNALCRLRSSESVLHSPTRRAFNTTIICS
ncbi:hypothetical protein NDU88_004867 [Pleurodeles waltl]|uniref:Uncharacterized protein n=1 Tax=Pleurodeles waltl TaxID=8319 RepID=A0AAV7PH88_PLEWA|nr:hypothetical protein NDU88_004867 [Pleurodeles waltl]